jgi:two-component system, NarL family, response regulator LiaR
MHNDRPGVLSLMAPQTIRVLLVDDHAVVREGLRAVLTMDGDIAVVGESATVEAALAAVDGLLPDVVLLDLVLRGEDGLEVLRHIGERQPKVKVVILTSFADESRVQAAVQGGALGFLPKDVPKDEIVRAIRHASQGRPALHAEAQRHLLRRARQREVPGPIDTLTPRERSILVLIARGYNNRAIAAELGLTTGTVKVNVSHVFAKLGVADRTQAALHALRARLVALDPGGEG